jgi:4-oxalocrotonate tautomerase
MPIIQINLLQGRSAEAKGKLASEMTRVTCECLGTAPEQVRIIFNDMPPENYSIAGTLVSEKKK